METLFNEQELDYLICAVIARQTEFEGRMSMMKRYASPEHLANHEAKIELGEVIMQKLTELERGF